MDGVPPVFIREDDIPDGDTFPTVLEVCLAVEQSIGRNTIAGSQRLSGLWRIYATSTKARNDLLIQGFTIRGAKLKVCDINPNILKDSTTGEEIPATKLWIDQVPLSVADSEFENSLKQIGCELRSSIKRQRARDTDGKLTRFLTGKRFLFISVPPKPLERKLKVCHYNASVWHAEQKNVQREVKCTNCLAFGHHRSVCDLDVVFFVCRLPGHKRGSDLCQLNRQHTTEEPAARLATDPRDEREERGSRAALASYAGAAAAAVPQSKEDSSTHAPTDALTKSTSPRGRDPVRRPTGRQSKLDFRPRSKSVKRSVSREGEQRAEKSMRIDRKDDEEDTWVDTQQVIEDQEGEFL